MELRPGEVIAQLWDNAEQIYAVAQRIEGDQKSRNLLEHGIIAGLIANTAFVGLIGIGKIQESPREDISRADCEVVKCATGEQPTDPIGILPQPSPSNSLKQNPTIPKPVQTAKPAKPAPLPPKPQPNTKAQKPPQASLSRVQRGHLERQPKIPDRNLSLSDYLANASLFIEKVPTLEALAAQFPEIPHFQNIEQKKSYIDQLDQEVTVSAEGYRAFAVDESRNRAFVGHPSYRTNINPRFFIIHWTASTNYADVDDFVRSMMSEKGNRKSVAYYIDDSTYHLVENDHRMTAHAKGVNDISQGVEIKAADLMDYKAHQLEKAVYLAVRFCRQNGLPVDATTIVSHSSADLIHSNPYYNPYKGSFNKVQGRPPSMRKFDPPQELMTVLVRKAMLLKQQLDAR